ncbi:hypothetical protein [Niallia sp.]|nr:hypothetical protein [Niallia sp.]
MKANIQIWIFISAILLVLGYIYSSPSISIFALVAAIIAYKQYKNV